MNGIKASIDRLGLRYSFVASEADVDPSTLSNWMHGSGCPTVRKLLRVRGVLRRYDPAISMDDLVEGL